MDDMNRRELFARLAPAQSPGPSRPGDFSVSRRGFLSGLGLSTLSAVAAGAVLGLPGIAHAGPKPVIQQGFRLVIDPGHGGENHGCRAHGQDEKWLTLALAQSLAGRIVELMPHAEVLLTREVDETLHLSQRVAFANACKADLFLSLHCNASPHADQSGFETFLLDVEASSQDAALTAQRENAEAAESAGSSGKPIPTQNDEVSSMLRELGMTNNRKLAAHYAQALQREHARKFPGRIDRGVRQASFDVLMGARMPAVLHEVAFLDHADDSKLLLDASGREQIVDVLAEATLHYYNDVVRRA
jgi:N-acetylmuramoyl-L-alanine amidase